MWSDGGMSCSNYYWRARLSPKTFPLFFFFFLFWSFRALRDVIIAMCLNLNLFLNLPLIFWGIEFIMVLPAAVGYADYSVRL